MLPLSGITVPLDGSAFAEQAIPLAAQLAQASKACLRLAYVHTPAAAWDPGIEFSLFDPEMEQQVREREMAYLDRLAHALTAGGGLHVERALLNGTVASSLQDYVERTGTDLVVMTSHGRGGVSRVLLGNVADQLILRLRIPVLVVRPEEMKQAPRGDYDHHRILVPLDGSPLAASILEQAKAFARMTRSELLLLMVVQPVPVLLPPFIWPPEKLVEPVEQRELEARRYLETLKKELRAEGFAVQTRVHTARKVARQILHTARTEECWMIALATHGASGLDRVMLGSIADQVIRHADHPILVLRPELAETEEEDTNALAAAAIAR
jgi:nucleotide-binding universal stress UspA family protein